MIDNYNPEDFERLKQEVETLVGRSVKTPKDFEFLSRQIEGYTNETISPISCYLKQPFIY